MRYCQILIALLCVAASAVSMADDYKLEAVTAAPDGLPSEQASLLAPAGHQLVGPDGPLCTIWLRKEIPVASGFSPTLNLKYPLELGEFVGVLQVPKGGEYTDFRHQVLIPGLYTLRYGKQPVDGNHVGTSDFSDFLLALPAKEDTKSEKLDDGDELSEISAEAAGTTHPAIYQLLPPPDEAPSEASLVEDGEYQILSIADHSSKPLALRLIVVGAAAE